MRLKKKQAANKMGKTVKLERFVSSDLRRTMGRRSVAIVAHVFSLSRSVDVIDEKLRDGNGESVYTSDCCNQTCDRSVWRAFLAETLFRAEFTTVKLSKIHYITTKRNFCN